MPETGLPESPDIEGTHLGLADHNVNHLLLVSYLKTELQRSRASGSLLGIDSGYSKIEFPGE